MNRTLSAAVALASLASISSVALGQPAASAPARARTLLMVDDRDILYRSGTQRVAHLPKHHSTTPIIPCDQPWEGKISYCSTYRDPDSGKYQLWYQAVAQERDANPKLEITVAYAESDDGITFTKPALDLFPFLGQPSNIVLDGNGGHGDRYCNSVIVDRNDPDPARRYKLAYYDWVKTDGGETSGLCVAFSPDGIHWTKHPGQPLKSSYGRYDQPPFADENPYSEKPATDRKPVQKLWGYPLTVSDVIDVFRDPVHNDYVINAKMWIDGPAGGGSWKNAVGQTRSKDFIHWSEPTLLITPDDQDKPIHEFHGGASFFHKGRYFCLAQVMDRRYALLSDIELMVSADGQKWERPFRDEFFLARTPGNEFDSHAYRGGAPPVVLEDEIRFYYGAYSRPTRDNATTRDSSGGDVKQVSGIGLATIPLDRFGGIKPVAKSDQVTLVPRKTLENIGQVTLKPLDLAGTREITINADASKGSVAVELLNEGGYRMRGFSKADTLPLKGDSLRHKVAWQGRDVSQLPAGRYMLRVHLDNATLYAIDFK